MTGTPDASRVLVAMRVGAPPARAFAAFTEQIGRWWRPDGLFRFTPGRTGTMAFEPGMGGRLVERYPDGTEFTVGRIRRWDPPHALVVGWRQSGFPADRDTELHVTFTAVPGEPERTRVTVEHSGWDRIPPENRVRHGFPLPVFQLRWAQWWNAQLGSLARAASAA